jgi:hypothetical protein
VDRVPVDAEMARDLGDGRARGGELLHLDRVDVSFRACHASRLYRSKGGEAQVSILAGYICLVVLVLVFWAGRGSAG